MDSLFSSPSTFLNELDTWYAQMDITRGKFNNASALERSMYWCQALHITNKDRYQNN